MHATITTVTLPTLAPTTSDRLVVDLECNTVTRGDVILQLSPSQAVMAHTLVDLGPGVVPYKRMRKALYGAHPGSDAERDLRTIRVMMTALRKLLAHIKVSVHTVHSTGYMLVLHPVT